MDDRLAEKIQTIGHCSASRVYFYRTFRVMFSSTKFSTVSLFLSLSLLSFGSTLKCTRIRIHIHLFTSLALSCLFWIVWYKFVVEDPDVLNANTVSPWQMEDGR